MGKIEAVLIAGPTASGKSALALRLARAHRGAVVNADSMQVYRDLRVVSARPTPSEEAEAPHRLYGHVDAASNHSVGRWLADATAVLTELRREGLLPIVVGGTGLYFQALRAGLSALPSVPEEVRAAVRAEAAGRATPDLHAALAARDPATAARLRPSDRLRVLRGLEIWAATGRSLVGLQGARVPGPLAERPVAAAFLSPDRVRLRATIDARFRQMIAAGALDEVRALAARGLDPALPAMRAHGVPALLRHGRGELSLEDAITRGQADTRAYVKRQFTWFRSRMGEFRPLDPAEAFAALSAELVART